MTCDCGPQDGFCMCFQEEFVRKHTTPKAERDVSALTELFVQPVVATVSYRIIDRRTERTLCVVGPLESGTNHTAELERIVGNKFVCSCLGECTSKYRSEVTI